MIAIWNWLCQVLGIEHDDTMQYIGLPPRSGAVDERTAFDQRYADRLTAAKQRVSDEQRAKLSYRSGPAILNQDFQQTLIQTNTERRNRELQRLEDERRLAEARRQKEEMRVLGERGRLLPGMSDWQDQLVEDWRNRNRYV